MLSIPLTLLALAGTTPASPPKLAERQADSPEAYTSAASALISAYLPTWALSVFSQSVSSAAAAASVTGDPVSLIYSALEASSAFPPWFSSAVPSEYVTNIEALTAAIASMRPTAGSPTATLTQTVSQETGTVTLTQSTTGTGSGTGEGSASGSSSTGAGAGGGSTGGGGPPTPTVSQTVVVTTSTDSTGGVATTSFTSAVVVTGLPPQGTASGESTGASTSAASSGTSSSATGTRTSTTSSSASTNWAAVAGPTGVVAGVAGLVGLIAAF